MATFHFPARNQSGQVAVAILLILTVMLTVAVSTALRTTEEVSLSTLQNEATEVFNLAESGIEVALNEGDFTSIEPSSGSVNIPEVGNANWAVYPSTDYTATMDVGQAATIALNENSSGLTVYWSKISETAEAERASVIIAVYYDDNTDAAEYYAVGPQILGVRADDFVAPENGGAEYNYKFTLPAQVAAGDRVFMRVIPVYNSTDIEVTGTNLPIQQHMIRSEALNDIQSQNFEKKTIEVTRTQPAAPVFMDYALYARGGIIKN